MSFHCLYKSTQKKTCPKPFMQELHQKSLASIVKEWCAVKIWKEIFIEGSQKVRFCISDGHREKMSYTFIL